MKKIIHKIKEWNKFWAFIENERINAMKYIGRGIW